MNEWDRSPSPYDFSKLIRRGSNLFCTRCGVRTVAFSTGAGSSFWNHIKDGQLYVSCDPTDIEMNLGGVK